ncbi:MAG TPA: ABC transporter ATP-binding protein [Euzebyales bacterium]|nr:ABC transporter ATP-binding protein [Euzebyales bacterium]
MTVPRQATTSPQAPASDVIATVTDLRVHFRAKAGTVHAVDGVSFDIRDGETLGLVGETGCGKSVTARSFLRLVPMPPGIAAGGSITFGPEGVDLTTADGRTMRRIRGDRIAMIFQDPAKALNPALTVRNQIAEVFSEHRVADVLARAGVDPAAAGGWLLRRRAARRTRVPERIALALPPLRSRSAAIERALDDMIADALAETQIANPRKVMDRYPHELSGGMRQRVMISQALACNPALLIADEPTTALDVTVQARIIELVRDLQQRHDTAVLYISHDLSLVRRVCDRVAVMYAGRIVEIGPTEQVLAEPLHPYTRGLLAAVPSATHRRGELVAIEGTVPELIDPPPSCRFAGRCPHAAPACERVDPVLAPVADGHEVACFLHRPPDDADADLPSADWVVR